MTTANPQQPPFTLFLKFSTEVRPSDLLRRDDRIPVTSSFEEIAESEEEDMQLSERTSSDARSPFAISFESPFAERRGTYPRDLSPTYERKSAVSRPGCGFLDPCFRRQQASTMFGSLSPEQHGAGHDFFTLPPIPESSTL